MTQDFHSHDLYAALGERRQLREPILDVGHRVVRLKVFFRRKHFVEDEVARRRSALLEEIDEVLGITPNQRAQRKRGFA